MLKRLREWWLYWQYRNITRRWQLLRLRLRPRARRHTVPGAGFRARGTAMYMPGGRAGGRALLFVAVVAAILAVVNVLLATYLRLDQPLVIDVLLVAALTYAYLQYAGA